MERFDVCIHGAGAVGRCLALALSRQGLQVALAGLPPRSAGSQDVRAYALNPESVALLQSLRVWDALPADAATPVRTMHVEGDQAGAELEFSAWQQRTEALAWIVDAAALEDTLADALRYAAHVRIADGPMPAPLTAYCDGRDSPGRAALGVPLQRHGYGQRAVAARLVADRPHGGIARQWFRAPDVLALLPFDRPEPGRSYALVWSLPQDEAERQLAATPADFEAALNAATGAAAGTLRLAGGRAAWPLQRAQAAAMSGEGWVLLGDAAHVVHPLAGQGLNLGLADVAALAAVISEREPWRPLSDARLLARYARRRALPTRAMVELTDGLLQLFAHPSPAARELRNRGLGLLDHLPPLKRWLTARALGA